MLCNMYLSFVNKPGELYLGAYAPWWRCSLQGWLHVHPAVGTSPAEHLAEASCKCLQEGAENGHQKSKGNAKVQSESGEVKVKTVKAHYRKLGQLALRSIHFSVDEAGEWRQGPERLGISFVYGGFGVCEESKLSEFYALLSAWAQSTKWIGREDAEAGAAFSSFAATAGHEPESHWQSSKRLDDSDSWRLASPEINWNHMKSDLVSGSFVKFVFRFFLVATPGSNCQHPGNWQKFANGKRIFALLFHVPFERNSYSTLFFQSPLTIRLLGGPLCRKTDILFGQESWYGSYVRSAATCQLCNFKGNTWLQEQQQSSNGME